MAGTVGLGLFVILAFEWNWLRRPLEAHVERTTHRSLTISDLNVRLRWPPIVSLRDVRFANANWAGSAPMARIARVDFSLSLADLLRGKVVIPSAALTDCDLRFERLADERKNWILFDRDETSPSRVRVGSVSMSRCKITYIDHGLPLTLEAVASDVDDSTTDAQEVYKTRYRFHGKYRDASFSGEALTGSASNLLTAGADLTVRGHLVAGTTTLDVDGSLADMARNAEADLQLRISGETLANLYPFLRLPLPASPPYEIDGRLTQRDSRFDLRDIRGRIGSTDVAGTAAYFDRQPRPLLQVKLHSDLLDPADLGPLVGVTTKSATTVAAPTQDETNTRASAQAHERRATGDRILPAGVPAGAGLLPAGKFEGGRLRAIDADAELSAKRIVAPDQLAAGNVRASVHLNDGVITLAPFDLELAGGRIASTIKLDARDPTLLAHTNIRFRRLQLGQLLPRSAVIVQSKGSLDGELVLDGKGNSVADVAANADGHINFVLSEAQISNLIDAAAGLNGAKILMLLVGGDKDIPVRCGAAAFDVNDGHGHSTAFVVDTEQTRIDGGGSVDFDHEQFDLLVVPQPKHASILSLRTPVRLHGTFREPHYELEKTPLLLRAGSAIALGLVSPAAAFLPLIETGPGNDVDCVALSEAVLATSTRPPK